MKVVNLESDRLIQFDSTLEVEAVMVCLAERGARCRNRRSRNYLFTLGNLASDALLAAPDDEPAVLRLAGRDADVAMDALRWYALAVTNRDEIMAPDVQAVADHLYMRSIEVLEDSQDR